MLDAEGYLHPDYAAAIAGDGRQVALPRSGGQLIVRRVPGAELEDATAPYPFLVCRDWGGLAVDVATLKPPLVSLAVVTDPLAAAPKCALHRTFNHLVMPYKAHFVVDLTRPLASFADAHHLGCARSALKKVDVERSSKPEVHLAEWLRLYKHLIRRHRIRGGALMTEESFRKQFLVPGLSVFRALREGATIGMILCMVQGERGYFHLGAYDDIGYRTKASYALVWSVIRYYAEMGLKILSIGAGAGAFGSGGDGLAAFKRGWASGTSMNYLCGHIIDAIAYEHLRPAVKDGDASYFPAYRRGEFD